MDGVGELLQHLLDGTPRTRSELATLTGLGRSTIATRVDALLASRLVGAAGEATSTGGRPPARFAFNPAARLVVAADVGATHVRLAVTDLAATVLATELTDLDVALGPDKVLRWVVDHGRRLVRSAGRRLADVAGVGIGLPGPVEHATGRPTNPPIMPGWDGFDVPGFVRPSLGKVVVVDNDVNIMALGERRLRYPGVDHLLFVKVATGIGSGIISDGALRRGAQGAAGDLGHIQVPHDITAVCRCGNVGCLEAVASGSAIAGRLRAEGVDAASSQDVVTLARGGSVRANALLREAGRTIGEVLASAVSLLNPSVIVIGGTIAEAGDPLIAGVREVVYRRSLPLATAALRIVPASSGDMAGVVGAAAMVIDEVLAPAAVDRYVG
ncbi:MAG TPA: ROK family protein [Ilumatobacteraceae bacterium]|nr:ROK family protein [Ilumatobacteraceae bacterium]